MLVQDVNNCSETFNVEVFQRKVIINYLVMDLIVRKIMMDLFQQMFLEEHWLYYLWSNGDFTSDITYLKDFTLEQEINSCVYQQKQLSWF